MNNISDIIDKPGEQASTLSCEIETSFADLDSIREDWDQFVLSVDGGIYFSYDWCRIWWKHYCYKRKLRIFLFRDNGNLIGIIPVIIDKIWLGVTWIKLAKLISSDSTLSVLKIPVLDSYANEVFRIVLKNLLDAGKSDFVWFGPISGIDQSVNNLRKVCTESNNVRTVYDQAASCHTIFYLPDRLEEYLSTISKNMKKNYRQGMNRLKKSFDTTFHVIRDSKNILAEFDKFIRLHGKQWKFENKLGHFLDWPHSTDFHRHLIETLSKMDRVRITKVSVDNKDIAQQFCYFFGATNYWRLPAREPAKEWARFSLGTVMFVHMIEASIKENISQVDGGQGHYDYKLKLGANEYQLQSILVGKNSFRQRVKAKIFLWLSKFLHIVYYKIWFCRLAPKLPSIFRRPLWKIWIRTRI